MDKVILKKFAIESRQDLMDKIRNKIKTFYIDEDFNSEQKGEVYVLSNEKHSLSLTNDEFKKRELLIKRVRELSLEQVIEEAAYTWFNRIIAIRYMEINDMLPLTKDNQSLGIRVLSSKDNTPDPEILKFTNLVNPELDIDFKKEKYVELKDDNEKFKYVLLLVCKKLGRVIPQVFDGVTDYIDILIPDNLLNDTGFITKVINEVPEDNYNQVEIIGWLYQYYNQTEKDRVMSNKKAYKKTEIPYATQIFTPDWVVKYMVENSLGKYYIEHNESDTTLLIKNWKYYIKKNIKNESKNIDIKNITFIDPCCGSGHILVYAFEIFYQIYKLEGYNSKEIPKLILTNNIYGLDVDDRAGQLSILSILLKACEYDKQIFNKNIANKLNIVSIQETNTISDNLVEMLNTENNVNTLQYLLDTFKNAKDIGSLLKIKNLNFEDLAFEIENDSSIFGIELREKIIPIIKVANILKQKFDIVVTNPPYMGQGKMNNIIKNYLIKYYKNGKTDLCTAFMLLDIVKYDGYLAMINQQAWMSLESFENLRNEILSDNNISSMIHLGFGTFGADFGTTTFVLKKNNEKYGIYFSVRDVKTSEEKEKEFLKKLSKDENYLISKNKFKKIPGTIISYWLNEKQFNIFENNDLFGKCGETKKGVLSGNDKRFLRLWFEVNKNKIGFGLKNHNDMVEKNYKWIPVTSGGNYRKWYGNFESVINLENDGYEIKNNKDNSCRLRENKYYFRECVTWSEVSMKGFSVRFVPRGILFGNSGPVCFFNNDIYYYLGFLNSQITTEFLKLLSPTLTFGPEQIKRLPVIFSSENYNKIVSIVKSNTELMKDDWDSFETSWDFTKHPLLKPMSKVSTIRDSVVNWNTYTYQQRSLLKHNEEELNKIFINIYGLNDELTPEVDDKDITIRKEDKIRDIKSFISYAVGCMFGRYSLDEDGLIYAGGEFDINKYKTFKVDLDNIIPITDEAYFSDDIVERFKTFIKTVYGDNTFNENMDFIAETLGKKGTETSEETIRRYFVNDFFNDHVKMYQKRPIYWLLDSGKKNGFKALIYMHRYNENLIPKARLDYLHRVQTTYEKLLSDVNYRLTTELSMTDKKEAKNRQTDLMAKLQEIKEYDEKIAHIANQRISIDLDDGVKVNYEKFKDILAKIK